MKTALKLMVCGMLLGISFSAFAEDEDPTMGFRGNYDGTTETGYTAGWALNSAKQGETNTVEFYIDDEKGPNTKVLIGSTKADKPREGFDKSGFTGNHGFTFQVPKKWLDKKPHSLHAYVLTGKKKKHVELIGSP